jgi:hypothetical protein
VHEGPELADRGLAAGNARGAVRFAQALSVVGVLIEHAADEVFPLRERSQ